MSYYPYLILFLIATTTCVCEDLVDHSSYCRERNRLVGTDKADQYQLIDGTPGTKVMMDCHYCHEKDDHTPKVWYRQDFLFRDSPQEVALGMSANSSLDRVLVNTQHRLTIKNISIGDEDIYFCHGPLGQEAEFKFNYFLDLRVLSTKAPLSGNLSDWKSYHDQYLLPMNTRLRLSTEPDFVRLRERDKLEVEAESEWEPWGPCGSCKGTVGTRLRVANCRLKPTRYDNRSFLISASMSDAKDRLFLTVARLSCQSEILSQAFPVLSEYTRDIPTFVRMEECAGACAKAEKKRPDTSVRYKKQYVLAERAHLILVCPESSMDTDIKWRKDGFLIDAAATYRAFTEDQVEPHLVVDTFNTLYLNDVTAEEAGNYTCYINGKRMQEVVIFVVSRSVLLQQAFLRHVAYIGLIFALSFVIYCAGVAILCTRRDKFKDFNAVAGANRHRAQKKIQL